MQEEVTFNWYFLVTVLLIVVILYPHPVTTPTGNFIHEFTNAHTWDLSNVDDYSYEDSLITLDNNQVQLVSTKTETSWTTQETNEVSLTSASLQQVKDNEDDEIEDKDDSEEEDGDENDQDNKTDKVNSINDKSAKLKDKKVLDVTFNGPLQTGDIVSLYLLDGKKSSTDLYLCDPSTICDSPGYGLVTFNDEGWYNITISGLESSTDELGLYAKVEVEVDYITGYQIITATHTNISITYPSSATIETADLQPNDISSWGTFSTSEKLNNQTISYQYSTDSGVTWTDLPEDHDLSQFSSSKMRFKATLSSNRTATPTLSSISVDYKRQTGCEENWVLQSTICFNNDSRLKNYIDTNQCGTTVDLPNDNGTIESCDYCLPSLTQTNTTCGINNTLVGWFSDDNNCFNSTQLVSDNVPTNVTYDCIYVTPSPGSSSGSSSRSSSSDGVSSGGGSGGGSTSRTAPTLENKETTLTTKVTETPTREKVSEIETICEYIVEIDLPEEISLTDSDSYEGTITNRGNCPIPLMNLQLNGFSEINLTTPIIQNINPGDASTFTLIRKTKNQQGLWSKISGAAISDVMGSNKLDGSFVLQGVENSEILFQRELDVKIKVPEPIRVANMRSMFGLNLFVIIMALFFIVRKRIGIK